jgi:hypothetical protein
MVPHVGSSQIKSHIAASTCQRGLVVGQDPPELTCPLSTVVFLEGKPQRPHRCLVALSSRTLVLRSFVVDRVGEQIPGRWRHRPRVSDVWRQLLLIGLLGRVE